MLALKAELKASAGLIKGAVDVSRQLYLIRKHHLHMCTKYNVNARQRSDTLFIMGSGASICEYPRAYWKIIRKANSIGLNNWVLHDFVPDFYVAELLQQPAFLKEYSHNLLRRLPDYAETTVILKWRCHMIEKLEYVPYQLNNVLVAATLTVPAGGDLNLFTRNLRFLNHTGLLSNSPIFFTRTASIDWCVLFGYKLGYRSIVLCGVDLNNTRYFWEANVEQYVKRGLIVPDSRQYGSVHKTLDPARCSGGIPIDQVLLAIRESLLVPRHVDLYVGSKNSALYPRLPVYPWRQGTVS